MPADGEERRIPSREFGKNAGIALAALALGLGLAEAGLRLFFPQPLAERYGAPAAGGPLVAIDPELGWRLRENVSRVASDEPWQADLATNSLGFRDFNHPEKAAGVTRVAVLGDSFVFGSGVKQDEPVTRRLAALLGPSFEVINLGVPGYGTDQALLTLRRWGRRLSPDVVLLGFFWNDVMENASAELYSMKKPRFVLAGNSLALVPPGETHGHSAAQRLDAALGARSHLWSLVSRSLRKSPDRVEPETRPVMVDLSLRAAPSAREPEFALTWALLGAFESEAHALGASPILFTVPPRFLVDDVAKQKVLKIYSLGSDALDEDGFFRVKEACQRRDLPVVDLLPAFRDAAKAGERLFLPTGIHWSAKGHALAARVLEPAVRDAARVREPSATGGARTRP
ncbi:MAG TPA: SGNH/GDSL hydrolase family protein [Thermoanaerobaculia bacterium]|nr:SGNH/GDSL hydrolase family protein [Thermoanaerobaculia bacterium]